MSNFLLEAGRQTLMLELQEASRLPERLGDDFIRAAETIIHCEGKLIVSGIGKSGHIGKKLAPTSSTVNTLMLGDALAMAVMQARGFNEEDFARSHPAGALGARLLNKVHHLMRRDEEVPRVNAEANVMDAMLELSRTGLGLVAVCDEANRVQGVFTDGDLRRWLVAGGTLNDGVTRAMTRNGVTLQADSRAVEAKERLMKHKISAAPVVDENGQLVGAINLQNFYQAGIL
ncbi:glucitol operon GutQ protein [Klebsiella pneumoniae]|uniref:KpsF/GutQ family sugar-phosphate isomerase n=1 Tax=Klebsiella pneumoniae TaxID=573 RepID=UPI000DE607A0|nr:KpsF/GutQ family sugar-phosphate isomerase [Klebsiella pneumoniae]SSK40100.1 glucitol operon GutQ protein [Klebsiella pneumoniae]